jgi:hypothetical protein
LDFKDFNLVLTPQSISIFFIPVYFSNLALTPSTILLNILGTDTNKVGLTRRQSSFNFKVLPLDTLNKHIFTPNKLLRRISWLRLPSPLYGVKVDRIYERLPYSGAN